MTKLNIILLCAAISLFFSVTTSVVSHYIFEQSVSAPPVAAPGPASAAALSLASAIASTPASITSAPAKPVSLQADIVKSCEVDIADLCGKAKDESKVMQCLQDRFSDVSPLCHESLAAWRENLAPCKSEVEQYCVKAGYGGGRIKKCLLNNQAHLSPACAKALSTWPHQ
jgi:hypothetical protein